MASSPPLAASPPKQGSGVSSGVSGSSHAGSRATKKARKVAPGSPNGGNSGPKPASGTASEQGPGPKKAQGSRKKAAGTKKNAAPSKSKGVPQPRAIEDVDFFDTTAMKRAVKIKTTEEIPPHVRASATTLRAWNRKGAKQREAENEKWNNMSLEDKVAAIRAVPRGGSTSAIPGKWSKYVGQLERKEAKEKQKADAAAAKEAEKRTKRDAQASLGRGQAGGGVAKPPSKSGGGSGGGRKSAGGYTKKGTRPTEAVHAGEAPALRQEGRAMLETATEVKMMTFRGRKSGDPENIPVHISFHGVVESDIGGGVKSKAKAKKKQLRIVGPDHKSTRKALKAALLALDELAEKGTDDQTEMETEKFKLSVFFDDGDDDDGDIVKKVDAFARRREVDKGGVKTGDETTQAIAASGTGRSLATPSKRRSSSRA